MLVAIEFWFSTFDSLLKKLQNCIFSRSRNHSVVEKWRDIFPWGPGFGLFWLMLSQFWARKLQFESKLISYSKSALKTESIHICFIYFWRFLFSSKISPYSPSGMRQKMISHKIAFWSFSLLPLCFYWCFRSSGTSFHRSNRVSERNHFLTYPWGGVGVKISMKIEILRNIWNIYESTQFVMLISNMI